MSDFLPYSTQWIDDQDIAAVVDVLKGGWLTTGPSIAELEEKFAAYCGAEHAVAVANGTAALHLVALAAGMGPGDVHLTTPMTFLATASCARYCGADVDFADIDPISLCLDPGAVAERAARHRGRLKMIAGVDFAGMPADWPALRDLADEYGAFLLEDACHAVGATYRGKNGRKHQVGDCAHADAAVFSLHPVKHFTSGEGGIITTNDAAFATKLRELRCHGMTKDPSRMQRHDGPWYYEMPALGFNYRLTDIQATLGVSQMRRVPAFVSKRQALAAKYDELLGGAAKITAPARIDGRNSSFHLYPIRVPADRRRQIFEALRAKGLGVQVHYVPVHVQPYYREHGGFDWGDFPEAEAYYNEAISIPLYPRMTDADVERVVAVLKEVIT